MTSTTTPTTTQISGNIDRPSAIAAPELRLSLKAGDRPSGYVDGAWWPASLDLIAEIPSLVTQLPAEWGSVDRVSYDPAAWLPAPRWLAAAGRRVRLDSFRGRRPTDAIHVVGAGRRALTLLVIPPSTDSRQAAATLRRAGTTGNQETTDDLLHTGLLSSGPAPVPADLGTLADAGGQSDINDDPDDLGRWDAEGGHDRRRAG